MSKIITVSNPSGYVLHFNEADHKYYDEHGRIFQPATKIIHSLFPEFEKDKLAYMTARKRLMVERDLSDHQKIPTRDVMVRKQEVLADWDQNGENSRNEGTSVHLFAETMLKGKVPEPTDNPRVRKLTQQVESFIPDLLEGFQYVESEKIIFSPKHRLAGTVDLIMRNKSNGRLCIFDWKTNKQIIQHDPYNKKGLLFLSHLDHCNYWHYALQLNLYRLILHQEGYGLFSNADMGLFHVTPSGVHGFKIPQMDWESEQLLSYAKNLKETYTC